MSFLIRPYVTTDAPALSALRWAAVHTLGRRAYSDAQLRAWRPEPEGPDAVRAHLEDGRRAWVIAHDSDPDHALGAIDLEADGHIDYLYLHPDLAGLGLGQRLIRHVLSEARHARLSRLFTEASELARPSFAACGFRILHRREFVLRGVNIHNYAMEHDTRGGRSAPPR